MQAGAGGESAPTDGSTSACTTLPYLTRESFLCASNYTAWQAAWFSELRKTRPAHKQSLLTSTGPCTRLHLSHLDFVLMHTKPLAVTQMELTEYSLYF